MKATSFLLRRSLAALIVCCWCATLYSINAAEPLVVCAPDGSYFATVADHGRIQYRTDVDNATQHTFYICHPQAICFSANGKLLAAAGGRNGCPSRSKFDASPITKNSAPSLRPAKGSIYLPCPQTG